MVLLVHRTAVFTDGFMLPVDITLSVVLQNTMIENIMPQITAMRTGMKKIGRRCRKKIKRQQDITDELSHRMPIFSPSNPH